MQHRDVPSVSALDRALENFRKFWQYLYLKMAGPRLHETRLCWVTDRLAVGPCIYTVEDARYLRSAGVTHVINLQRAVDYRANAEHVGLVVRDVRIDDDLSYKPPEFFDASVGYALQVLADGGNASKLYIHCTAGVHRGPMLTLAIMGAQGYPIEDAIAQIQRIRPQARFPEVYRRSVEDWLAIFERERRAAAPQ